MGEQTGGVQGGGDLQPQNAPSAKRTGGIVRILHVSDLHIRPDSPEHVPLIKALLQDVRRYRDADGQPDIIVFSGDLVQAGEHPSYFQSARAEFIEPLCQAAGVELEQFLVVPGNHDISRASVRNGKYIEDGLLGNLTSVSAVNDLIDKSVQHPEAVAPAIARLDVYEQFYRSLPHHSPQRDTPFVRTYIIGVRDVSVGIALFNSAWRATGEDSDADLGRLLIGERAVDWAGDDLRACDLTLAVMHHPLEWLRPFEKIAIETLFLGHFDVVLTGHLHHSSPQTRMALNGSALFSQAGCLYESATYLNGYQMLEIDTDSREALVKLRTYFPGRREYDAGVNLVEGGRRTFFLAARRDAFSPVGSFLRIARRHVRERANRNVSLTADPGQPGGEDIKTVFVCPPLSRHSDTATNSLDAAGSRPELLDAEAVLGLRANVLVMGPRESGKTIMANFMAVRAAEGCCDQDRIPVLIDTRTMKRGSPYFGQAVQAYYLDLPMVPAELRGYCTDNPCLVLLDNFNPRNAYHLAVLADLRKAHPKHRFIVFGDAEGSGDAPAPAIDGFEVLHILRLPRKSIRELSRRLLDRPDDNGEIFETIMKQLEEAQLPRNGYIVSLLIWAASRGERFQRLNEAVLVETITDHLLGKAALLPRFHGDFDPTAKGILLSAIAVRLRECGGVEDKNDFLKFVIDFLKAKGLPYDAVKIITQLLSCRILSETMGKVSFTFRCFQEYFVSRALRDSPDYLSRSTSGLQILDFSREVEFLVSLSRRSTDLPEKLRGILNRYEPPAMAGNGGFLSIASRDHTAGAEHITVPAIKKRKLPVDKLDDLLDEIEHGLAGKREDRADEIRRAAVGSEIGCFTNNGSDNGGDKDSNGDNINVGPLADPWFRAIRLFGRVIRNSEFDDLSTKKELLRDYLARHDRGVAHAAGLVEEAFAVRKSRGDEFPAEAVGALDSLIQLIFQGVYLAAASDAVTSRALLTALRELFEDEGMTVGQRVLLVWCSLDMRELDLAEQLFRHRDVTPWALRLVAEKLGMTYFLGAYRKDDENRLENLIAEYGIALGDAQRFAKGRVIQNIRKTLRSSSADA